MRVRDIGEQGLLQRLQAFCPAGVVGDDAAVLTTQAGRSLVVTSDVLVDGVHFSDRTTSPEDAGWRAAAANLSDLAAMGATPLGVTVGLSLPGEVPVDWVDRLYRGMAQCLQQYGTAIVGGDVVRSPIISVAITAFGEADPDRVIRRRTAMPGDAIVVTGYHGASRAGLELLLHPELSPPMTAADRSFLIQAHQRPRPRLDVLPLLWRWGEAKAEGRGQRAEAVADSLSSPPPLLISGMDSSDGLADAVIQVCRASRVGAQVDRDRLPTPPALHSWLSPEQALHWTLYGGEDFELVLCLQAEAAKHLVHQLGEGAAMIGTVTADPGIWLVDSSGNYPEYPLTLEQGFQHFGEESAS